MDKIRILLVEDEPTMAMIIQETLEDENFLVELADNGVEGLRLVADFHPHVIVTDVMMPDMDGFEMVRRIRKNNKNVPVLFLTSRSAVKDVVEGFQIGGNDYLRKPFSMLELLARIKALALRTPEGMNIVAAEEANMMDIGLYKLNVETEVLSYGNETEQLSHRESELLRMLATKRGEVVSTHDILMELWGDDTTYNANSLQVFITKMRHKLSRDEEIKIINVRGIGYKLIW